MNSEIVSFMRMAMFSLNSLCGQLLGELILILANNETSTVLKLESLYFFRYFLIFIIRYLLDWKRVFFSNEVRLIRHKFTGHTKHDNQHETLNIKPIIIYLALKI